MTGSAAGPGGPRTAPPGPVGEEAARLLHAVQGWWQATLSGAAAGHPVGAAAECRVCPFCALVRLVRDNRPETYAHLQAAAESLLAAARTAVDQGGQAGAGGSVQHIDVG